MTFGALTKSDLRSINLASNPFRNDRPMLLASVAVGVLQLGVLALLIFVGFQDRSQTAELRQASSEVRGEIASLNQEANQLQTTLQQPQNAAVLGRSEFLNELLLRKGISWTRIFDDLEGVVPYNVQLISIRPQVDADNVVLLDMVLGAQSKDAVIEMIRRLEQSPRFGETFVHNYLPPSQNEPLYRYRISVRYAQKL